MSFRRMIVGLTFIAVFTMAVRVSVDTDTWWHLRAGAWIVEHGQILQSDPFSLTRQGESWIYPGWLAQIGLYAIHSALGFAGLNLITALMVVLAFSFVWLLLEGPLLMRAFVLLLATTVSGVYWSARPHIFSFALVGIFLWVLARARAGNRAWLWGLPPLMALWSNLHGGFAIGFMLIAAYLVGEVIEASLSVLSRHTSPSEVWRERRSIIQSLIIVGLVCAAAVAINPHGPQMLLYPFKTVSVSTLQAYIQEWQSPDFHRLEVQPFLWMLILCMVVLALSNRRKNAVELVLVASFAYLSLVAARNIALFALVSAPVVARHGFAAVEPLLKNRKTGSQLPERLARRINVALFFFITLAALIKISVPLSDQVNREAIAGQVPVEAVDYLSRQSSRGPLFNSYNWGGYILWELYPEHLSFVDGRTDLFDDVILSDYILAWRADPGWEQVIDRWNIQVALLETSAPLARAMECKGWVHLYVDDKAVILSRSLEP
ncbi:MAG: hypothetical protein E3J37_05120 [Anaerolineales bacterium]|nr:MAG: hypothetical protein E3J37_05120 [Anaerolineales bacterium]